jgi:hypothetical protein
MLELVNPLVQAEKTLVQGLLLAYDPINGVVIYWEFFGCLESFPVPPYLDASSINLSV